MLYSLYFSQPHNDYSTTQAAGALILIMPFAGWLFVYPLLTLCSVAGIVAGRNRMQDGRTGPQPPMFDHRR
ncbi:hypothetical protein HMPREF0291_11173 [Corynebacterium genitalium ATCC 33030]|uniref:Uncharacterized protein n=1 Tax=Corynebacterium genitalium ATCC 33030 TaxID=585529 RepID=D7WED9_9CORY|nr:hypothetical protein HMPREF0291_11173 [Corynebacterium genitalium ATCC 33030]